jgi:ribosomal protein S18 acetylase RimI-like enzyme
LKAKKAAKAGLTGENRTVKMEIIEAIDSHIPEIVELWKEFMDFHKDIDPVFSRSEDGHLSFEKHLRDSINSEDWHILVALDKGCVVGFSTSQISKYAPVFEMKTHGGINTMAVKSNYRRKGIGEQMLEKILKWFESRNIDRIELSVAANNQIGYSFWKKHGFKDYRHRLYLDRG